jgi:hypothetical protein
VLLPRFKGPELAVLTLGGVAGSLLNDKLFGAPAPIGHHWIDRAASALAGAATGYQFPGGWLPGATSRCSAP